MLDKWYIFDDIVIRQSECLAETLSDFKSKEYRVYDKFEFCDVGWNLGLSGREMWCFLSSWIIALLHCA